MWLNRTEDEVWRLTPRKFQSLLTVHYDIIRQKNGKESIRNANQVNGYIDDIPGW